MEPDALGRVHHVHHAGAQLDRWAHRMIERLANFADYGRLAQGRFGGWAGLGPDDSIRAARDTSVQEIYALDWELP